MLKKEEDKITNEKEYEKEILLWSPYTQIVCNIF